MKNVNRIIIVSIITCFMNMPILVTSAFAEEKKDTGVGKNGVALESSPAFEKGGIQVAMFNIVRAETAKYFAEETILSGGNTMRHERNGIDLKKQTVIPLQL